MTGVGSSFSNSKSMSNREVIQDIIRNMMSGATFVEISTYLQNHTTLNRLQCTIVAQDLYAIQRLKGDINKIADGIFSSIE